MPIVIDNSNASIVGICTVEDAEPVLEWLVKFPGGIVDLTECENLHTSVLQALLIGRARISKTPLNFELSEWIKAALPTQEIKKRVRKNSVKLEKHKESK